MPGGTSSADPRRVSHGVPELVNGQWSVVTNVDWHNKPPASSHPPSVLYLCFFDSIRPLWQQQGRICHTPAAYWKVAASTNGSVFWVPTGPTPGSFVFFDPQGRGRRDALGRRGGGGWGWDPPEATRSAVFATLTRRTAGEWRRGSRVGGFVDETGNQDTRRWLVVGELWLALDRVVAQLR